MTTSYTQKSSSLLIRGSLVQAHLEAHKVRILFKGSHLFFIRDKPQTTEKFNDKEKVIGVQNGLK